MRARWLAVSFVLAALGSGCGEKIQETYRLEIIGPTEGDYLMGARTVVLEVGGREVARTDITPGRSFSLTGSGINTPSTAALRVRVLDAAGAMLAFGETPDVDLALVTRGPLRVFVQKPGTLGRSIDLPVPWRGHVAAAVQGPPADTVQAPVVTVAMFGTGHVLIQDPQTKMVTEPPTDILSIYNPLVHEVDDLGSTASNQMGRQLRSDAAMVVRPDNTTLIFGGLAQRTAADDPHPTSLLDVLRLQRSGFDVFELAVVVPARQTDKPGVARSRSVLAAAGTLAWAFGGRDDSGPLDSVVQIDPLGDEPFTVLTPRMAGPREGHTASAVTVRGSPEVLVFGGGPMDAAVAEVLVPGPPAMLVRPTGDAGGARRDHAAVMLPAPDGRVLIVGGVDAGGKPRADSVAYVPETHTFEKGPIALRTARSGFTAFVIGADLVIAGGIGEDGKPIADAEVFTLGGTITARAPVPAFPRAHATASVLGNESAVVLGGEAADGSAVPVTEVYQPLR
jgi:hypothetical protein